MLLDQKRTKRIVKITAILTSIAFAGVAVVIIALIIFGGTPSQTQQQLKEARELVEREPRNPEAWEQLASAYDADGNAAEAVRAAERAAQLSPNEFSRLQTLVGLYAKNGQEAQSLTVVQAFTRRNPQDAEGFLLLGRLADNANRADLARLAYQTYIRLDPESVNASAVRERLEALRTGAPAAP